MRIALILLALAACQSSDVSRSLGARCDRNTECDQLCLGPSGDWPGGFCTTSCDSDVNCASGAHCIDEGNAGVCAVSCGIDSECAFLGAYTCQSRDRHNGGNKVMVCRGG